MTNKEKYYCEKCRSYHRTSSNIGKEHKIYDKELGGVYEKPSDFWYFCALCHYYHKYPDSKIYKEHLKYKEET